MAPQSATAPAVNNILQTLRGEQFRRARNAQSGPAPTRPLSSYAHNQPTLPLNLIYPTHVPDASRTSIPGPSPPRSWRSSSSPPPPPTEPAVSGVPTDTPAWRERALSLLFSPSRTIPQLTVLCLQVLRAAFPGSDLADVVPFIPPHLRRILARHAAIHAPLSQIELDALCGGTAHVDTERIVVGPHTTLRAGALGRHGPATTLDVDGLADGSEWDAVRAQDDPPGLRLLAVLSSPLSPAAMLAFPPTVTHLALINLPHRIPLSWLPTMCPLVVLLDVSYNAWLRASGVRGPPMLEEVEWCKWQRLEVLGLRECLITPKLLLELNRGRWEDVNVIQ